ncbi:MAG: hypothetical protein ABJO86_08645 [Lentilitoribacter sp.]
MLKTMFWPGLVTILSLSILAIWFHHNSVEFELRKAALIKLSEVHEWAEVRLNGRDLSLYGISPSVSEQEEAIDKLNQLNGVRVVIDQTTLLPMATPFTTTISLSAGEIKITGNLPVKGHKIQVIKLLSQAVPAVSILDEAKTARGAPEMYVSLVERALKDVSQYPSWEIEIIDNKVKLTIPSNDG